MPTAVFCTACLTARGDVRPIRKFEEHRHSGELVETYFTSDPYVEHQIQHRNQYGPKVMDAFGMHQPHEYGMGIGACDLHTAITEQSIENQRESA